jgi:Family of unknown function (DUF6502)
LCCVALRCVGQYPTTPNPVKVKQKPPMSSRSEIVLGAVLRVMQPLTRLLLQHGVTYPVLSAALKRVFLLAAQAELAHRGMPATDSAITLLSGVHRRDVRNLSSVDAPQVGSAATSAPMGLVGQVVARWLTDTQCLDRKGAPKRLARSGEPPTFDALVASVSSDVRPRAMLDEMLRLGVVSENDHGVALSAGGFAPREGLAEMAALAADNLKDHAAAAAANVQGETNFLEQAIYVDDITPASARAIHDAAVLAWKKAFQAVMKEAQGRFDADAAEAAPGERTHRARFGVYFFNDKQD